MYPSSRCTILLVDQKKNRAVVVAETKSDRELNIPLNLKNYPEIRKVIETRKPLAIADVQRHPLMREMKKILAAKAVYSLLLVPVFYQKELIGIIFLRAVEAKYDYRPADIRFARLVSDSLALALKNLRLARLAVEESREKEQAISRAKYSGAVSRRLEKLFEYASDGLIIINDKGETTGVNLNFLRLSGFERRELIGKTIDGLLELDKPKEENIIDWLNKRQRGGSTNLLLKTKQGEKKYVAAHIELLPGARKEYLVSVHDITEEHKLSLELKQTKEFLEGLIANSMEAIIAADMNGKIILFNQAAERLTGYKAEEVLNRKNIVDLYTSGTARDIMKKLRSPFYGGPGKLETTHNVLVGKNGEEIPINMSAAMVYDSEGKPIATMGLYQDLRPRIEIEKRLRQAQERLLESKRKEAVMALAGAAAHELNQPLTSIIGYAEILQRAEAQLREKLAISDRVIAPVKNAIKVIADQAQRMAEVIKKLGDLTEFETTDYTGKQKILDLDQSGRLEKNLERALALVGESILLIDPELVILEAFGQAERLFGEKPAGKSLSRYLEGVNYTLGVKLLDEARTKASAQHELDLRPAGGRSRRVLMRAEKADEKTMLAVFYDVEQLAAMQSQLKELTAFREQLFQTMPLPLIVMDADGRITHISREAERLFGYSLEEVKGKPPAMVFDNFEPNMFVAYLRKVRQEEISEGTLAAKDKLGRKFEIYYFFGTMRAPTGEIIGYLAFMVDLSEKHLLEQALKEKTTILEAIQKNTAILVQASDWQEALIAMLNELRKLLEFDVAMVIPSEQTERGFYFLSYYPTTGEKHFQEQRAFEQSERALFWLTNPEVRYFEDLSKISHARYARAPGDVRDTIGELIDRGIVNFVSIPLKFQDEVIGRIFFGHHQPGFLKPEKLEPVRQMIEQITIAVSNFRLYFRIEKQRERLIKRNLFLEQVLEQSQKIDLQRDESQIFAQFLNLFQGIFPRAHLWLAWKNQDQQLIIKSVSNLEANLIGREVKLTPHIREKIMAGNKPCYFEPGTEVPSFLEGSLNLTLVPIISEAQLSGIMAVESHHKEPFLEEEMFLLQLFSRYLALLLPNLLHIRQAVLMKFLLESLIESTNAFILMIGEDGRIIIFNRAFEEKLGLKKEQLHDFTDDDFIKKHLVMVQKEKGQVVNARELFAEILQGRKFSSLRVRFRAVSGELFEAIFNVAGLKDQSGNFLGMIAVGQDLSPLRELEAKLMHYERLAGLGQMAAGVVHELNNPLQAIITYSELVKRRMDEIGETDTARKISAVVEAGERVRRLSRNLISYARPGTEKVEDINLKTLVDEILSFSSYELSRGGVEIKNQVPENLPPLKAVKDQIEQLVLNLLTNASHACSAKGGGQVVVKASSSDHAGGAWLTLQVEDNGVGIREEHLPRIFEPFFTTKPGGKGTGLGLNIVHAIVERHNGKIKVESKFGKGTVFTIEFPLLNS
jgi:PAS domain S-box-containing protein